jgi:hypothetical protein
MKYLSQPEQRRQHSANVMTAVQLEAHLLNLKREILAGDFTKVVEFQQFIQYAPTEMKQRLDPHRKVT